jgi:hypothetical protein
MIAKGALSAIILSSEAPLLLDNRLRRVIDDIVSFEKVIKETQKKG